MKHAWSGSHQRSVVYRRATEREMQRNPLAGNMSMSAMMVAHDDLHMRLLLLENRGNESDNAFSSC